MFYSLILCVLGQTIQKEEDFKPKEVTYPFVQVEVLNSANNLFKRECVETWIKNLSNVPVYLVDNNKEELVGKAVCAYWNGDWAIAKIELKKPVPEDYVLRPHSKPVKVEVNEGCYFHISKAELLRLLIVNPIYASKYPPSSLKKDNLILP